MSRCIFVAHATSIYLCLGWVVCVCVGVYSCSLLRQQAETQLTANLWLTSWLFQTDFYRNIATVSGYMEGVHWEEEGGMHKDERTHDEQLTGFDKLFIVRD